MDPQTSNSNQPSSPADTNPATAVEPIGGSTPVGGAIEPPALPVSQPYDPLAPGVPPQPTNPAQPAPLPPGSLPQPAASDAFPPAPIQPEPADISGGNPSFPAQPGPAEESGQAPQQPFSWSPAPATDQPTPVPPASSGMPNVDIPSGFAPMEPVSASVQPEPAAEDPYSAQAQPALASSSDPSAVGFDLVNNSTPPWAATPQNQQEQPLTAGAGAMGAGSEPPTPNAQETVPTDLSHLVDNSAPVIAQPETLIVPPAPDPNQAVASTPSKGFPKVLLILAGLILILVAGASAYFILGVGRPQESVEGGSIPAQPEMPAPEQAVPTVQPTAIPAEGTSSATFGNVNGSTGSARVQTSPTPTGTSAIDLLRRRTTTTTPTP